MPKNEEMRFPIPDEQRKVIEAFVKEVTDFESTVVSMTQEFSKRRGEMHDHIWDEVIPGIVPEFKQYHNAEYRSRYDGDTGELVVVKREDESPVGALLAGLAAMAGHADDRSEYEDRNE